MTEESNRRPDTVSQSRPAGTLGQVPTDTDTPDEGEQIPQEAPAAPRRPRSGPSYFVVTVLILAATALSVSLLRQFASIIAPVFLGLNLLLVTYPVYRYLARHGVPRVIASLAAGLAVLAILVLGIATIVWSGTSMVQALTGYSDEFTQLYHSSLEFLGRFGLDQSVLMEQLRSISPSNVLGAVSGLISSATDATGILLILLLTLVFMTMDLPTMRTRFRITNHLHPEFVDAIRSLVRGVRRYWFVTTLFGLIVAAMDFVVLLAVGVPLPLVWAVLAFVSNYIPNVGFLIGLAPPALLALMEEGPVAALVVVVLYSVINFVMQSIIQPKVTGDAVGVSPVVSLLSLLVWTVVFGPLGALLALPLTLVVKSLLIDSDPRARWVNALISANPRATVTSRAANT